MTASSTPSGTAPALTLYNTLSRQKDVFVPMDAARVTMYVCGPTVYNYAHIGNARSAVAFDLLSRVLRHLYPNVIYARNITDIDDQIMEKALQEGAEISEITQRYADIYRADMGALGVGLPDIEPLATETIPEMISMMERLIAADHAYAAEGHVLFDVPSFPEYGALSRRPMDEMIAGARVEVAPYKKNASDFVLWKPSADEQPGWDSPWGRGRPGWHLECSAMIEKHLGKTIDIHGGGIDLQFPHHENELAQSRCSHDGAPFANYWLHNGFLNMNSEKMSKSLGNVLLIHDLIEQIPGEAIRLALLNGHYRQPLEWNDDVLPQAKAMLDRLYGALRQLDDVEPANESAVPTAFLDALLDDLNTPKALSELFAMAKQANVATDGQERATLKAALIQSGLLLGLLQQGANSWFEGEADGTSGLDAAAIEAQIGARNAARAAKDFAEADRIRDALADAGVLIEDGPEGTKWKLAG